MIQQPRIFQAAAANHTFGTRHTNGGSQESNISITLVLRNYQGATFGLASQGISHHPKLQPRAKIDPASAANVLHEASVISRDQEPQIFFTRSGDQPNRRLRSWSVFGDNVGLPQATFNGLTLGIQITGERGIIKNPPDPFIFALLDVHNRNRNTLTADHQVVGHRLQGQGALAKGRLSSRRQGIRHTVNHERSRANLPHGVEFAFIKHPPHFQGTIQSRTSCGVQRPEIKRTGLGFIGTGKFHRGGWVYGRATIRPSDFRQGISESVGDIQSNTRQWVVVMNGVQLNDRHLLLGTGVGPAFWPHTGAVVQSIGEHWKVLDRTLHPRPPGAIGLDLPQVHRS